jgi:hypothetical protein
MQASRRVRHERASAFLAARGDAELAALVGSAPPGEVGVGGGSATLDVCGVPVFTKRVPLSDRELAHPYRTANLFDLPLFCQYGIGSPGFGAWRELAANRLVADAVVAGETSSFPLLYHWRVLAGRPPVALDWLRDDPIGKARTLERQLSGIVAFLRGRELLHMDGHFANLRTDGADVYLADFGLATSPRFELSPAERAFVARHATHDAAYAAMRLVNWLVTAVCGVPVPATGGPVARNEYVRRCATGDIPDDVPPVAAEILARHAPAAARMNSFYWSLFGGELDAGYPADELRPAFRPAPQ